MSDILQVNSVQLENSDKFLLVLNMCDGTNRNVILHSQVIVTIIIIIIIIVIVTNLSETLWRILYFDLNCNPSQQWFGRKHSLMDINLHW